MSITRFHPMTDFVTLREAMDRLVEDSFIRPSAWPLAQGVAGVPVDLWETSDAYHLKADLPGVGPDDIDISATNDSITISGEMAAAATGEQDGWLRRERRAGKFTRSFTLPLEIDPSKVEATFEHGVLHLTLPKAEAVRPRTIKVRPATK